MFSVLMFCLSVKNHFILMLEPSLILGVAHLKHVKAWPEANLHKIL